MALTALVWSIDGRSNHPYFCNVMVRLCATYVVWPSVNLTQFMWVCVSDAGHIQFQDVMEPGPEDAQQVPCVAEERRDNHSIQCQVYNSSYILIGGENALAKQG